MSVTSKRQSEQNWLCDSFLSDIKYVERNMFCYMLSVQGNGLSENSKTGMIAILWTKKDGRRAYRKCTVGGCGRYGLLGWQRSNRQGPYLRTKKLNFWRKKIAELGKCTYENRQTVTSPRHDWREFEEEKIAKNDKSWIQFWLFDDQERQVKAQSVR